MKIFLVTIVLLSSVLMIASCSYGEAPSGKARATFAVHCYTVGEHALKGQPGVLSVEPGWRDFREVDRVVFDPDRISVAEMEAILRKANTYVGTVEVLNDDSEKKELKR